MDYWQFIFTNDTAFNEVLIAFVGEMPFDTFEENETGFSAFIPAEFFTKSIENQLIELKKEFDFDFEKKFIKGQNWNEIWESNFHPILVDDFCSIRADFHSPPENVRFDLVINPKMAFGTGHHETTRMMIRAMEHLDFEDKKVFDFGCGTGILAILAAKMGASAVEAIDIEEAAFQNSLENCEKNNVSNVEAHTGVLSDVRGGNFDVILANINRNVILESLSALKTSLNKNGYLLISGFLQEDVERMKSEIMKVKLFPEKELKEGNWVCMVLRPSG